MEGLGLDRQLEQRIEASLASVCAPLSFCRIVDETHAHRLHAGYRESGGARHYALTVVSSVFQDLPLRERHRVVYSALQFAMPHTIHAVRIFAHTPEEYTAGESDERVDP